jgi:hypothetical protein
MIQLSKKHISNPKKATKNHLPSSSMSNPFNNVGNKQKKKQFEQMHLFPNINNTSIVALPSTLVHWWVLVHLAIQFHKVIPAIGQTIENK